MKITLKLFSHLIKGTRETGDWKNDLFLTSRQHGTNLSPGVFDDVVLPEKNLKFKIFDFVFIILTQFKLKFRGSYFNV